MKMDTHLMKAKQLIVCKKGLGDFTTVQEAIDSIPEHNSEKVDIFIRNGVYQEVVKVTTSKRFVSLIGESKSDTIISYHNYAGKEKEFGGTYGTSGSASVFIFADDFRAENITIENSFDGTQDVTGRQAVAAYTSGSRLIFKNVKFISYQDTLYANAGTQYFYQCYIKGDVDFIFGAAQAVFKECEIFSVDRGLPVNGYVTAASTLIREAFGYLFINCSLLSDAADQTVYLGRPWHPGRNPNAIASVLFRNCYLGSHIHLEGWTDMSGFKASEARFFEYNNRGPGASSHEKRKQLTDEEANEYAIVNVLGGWRPIA
jgi:pectinesterase